MGIAIASDPIAHAPEGRNQRIPLDWLGALAAFTMISIIATFPLIFHLNDRIIGPFANSDNTYFAWSLWIFRHAIASGHDPSHTHNIYALLPSVQVFVDAHFDEVLGVPLQWIFSPLATYNLLVLLGFALSGLTMYLLAEQFVRDRLACFAAGFLWTFSSFHFARSSGHLGLATLQWLPFCVWRVFRFWREPSVKNALLAGLGVALVPLSDIYYLGYFLLPFGALFLVGKLVTERAWFTRGRNLLLGGLAIVVAAALLAPALVDYIKVDPDVRGQIVAEQSTDRLSADLVSFVLPSPANPYFGATTTPVYARMKNTFGPIETANDLGIVALTLGLAAFLFRRNRSRTTLFWFVLGLCGVILGLGSTVFVAGHTLLHLPLYRWIFGWPLLSSYRAPNRLAVLPIFALALLAAYTLDTLRVRLSVSQAATVTLRCVTVLLLGASLCEQSVWSFPLPSVPVEVPQLYHEIAADARDTSVLDVPLQFNATDEFYQTVHHKRLVYGYAPRNSARMIDSVHVVPYLSQFDPYVTEDRAKLIAEQGDIFPTTDLKGALQRDGIGYVVLHRDRVNVTTARYNAMQTSLEDQLGAPMYDNTAEGLTAWRVEGGAPPDSLNGYRFELGTGWLAELRETAGQLSRAVEQDGQIIVEAPRQEAVTLGFRAMPFFKPRTMEVRLNGAPVKTIRLTGALQNVVIDGAFLHAGANTIELHALEGCSLPREFAPANLDTRCFSFGIQQIQLSTPQGLLAPRTSVPSPVGSGPAITYGSGWLATIQEGTGQTVGAVEQDGQILVTAPHPEAVTLSFLAAAYFKPITLEVRLNNVLVQSVALPQPDVPLVVYIHGAMLQAGTNIVELHSVEGCSTPNQFDPKNPDSRCFSLRVEQVRVLAA